MKEFIILNKELILKYFLIIYGIMSSITLILYIVDKNRAINNKWRIKESVLLLMPWLFGSLGGLLGLYLIRHKTKHMYFKVNNIFAIIIHIIILVYLLFV